MISNKYTRAHTTKLGKQQRQRPHSVEVDIDYELGRYRAAYYIFKPFELNLLRNQNRNIDVFKIPKTF